MRREKAAEDPNDRYFNTHFARLVKEHGGEWIVLVDGKLIGIGREKDLGKLMAKARRTHPRSMPFAAPIPARQDLQCLL